MEDDALVSQTDGHGEIGRAPQQPGDPACFLGLWAALSLTTVVDGFPILFFSQYQRLEVQSYVIARM